MAKTKFDKGIESLIPYLERDFMTFPLAEEGNYSPQLNFWQIFDEKCITDESIIEIAKELEFPEKFYLDFQMEPMSTNSITLADFEALLLGNDNILTKINPDSSKPPRFMYHFSVWSWEENKIDTNKLIELSVLAIEYFREHFKHLN